MKTPDELATMASNASPRRREETIAALADAHFEAIRRAREGGWTWDEIAAPLHVPSDRLRTACHRLAARSARAARDKAAADKAAALPLAPPAPRPAPRPVAPPGPAAEPTPPPPVAPPPARPSPSRPAAGQLEDFG